MKFRIDIKTSKRHGTADLRLLNLNRLKGGQQLWGSFSALKNLEGELQIAFDVMQSEMEKNKR